MPHKPERRGFLIVNKNVFGTPIVLEILTPAFPGPGVARTLDVIGERWTILLLRDLFLQGPRRFQDFQESLAGVAPNTLSARLKDMEEHGLIERRVYSNHPPRLEYYLTEKGKSLAPVLKALRDWGQHHR